MSFAIVTAANALYFGFALNLVLSIKASAYPDTPDIYLIDVGLNARQAKALAPLVRAVIPGRWDVDRPKGMADFFRAMTARPFLPEYVPADIIVWIDSDAWVQRWTAVTALIDGARDGRLAIVEEVFGSGIVIQIPDGLGQSRAVTFNRDTIIANIRQQALESFGNAAAEKIGAMPSFNSGVFALRSDSPYWAIWKETLKRGLARKANFLTEQNALNIAIRDGRIDINKFSITHNFVCIHGLPEFDSDNRLFINPVDGEPIGILHLADAKHRLRHPLVQRPSGLTADVSLLYIDSLFKS